MQSINSKNQMPFIDHQLPFNTINGFNKLSKKIQNYQFNLTDQIGKGNFSKVFKGINICTDQIVAIKVIELNHLKNDKLLELLYSEIQILKSLSHPNIMKCYEAFTSVNNCYIITEYCNQGNLQGKLKQMGQISQIDSYKIIYELFNALKYLGQQGIIHRDLKIANILLKDGKIKIADFGFSKRIRQKFKDMNIGSPIYMSPQGLLHNIYGPKTDIWAFGTIIFQILHGYAPLHFCKTQNQLRVHIKTPLNMSKININLSMQLKQLILRCLDIDQRTRIDLEGISQLALMKRLYQIYGQKTKYNIIESQVQEITGFCVKENFHEKNILKNSYLSTQVAFESIQERDKMHPQINKNKSNFARQNINQNKCFNQQKKQNIEKICIYKKNQNPAFNKIITQISNPKPISKINHKIQKKNSFPLSNKNRSENISFQSPLGIDPLKKVISVEKITYMKKNTMNNYSTVKLNQNQYNLQPKTFLKKNKKILSQNCFLTFQQCVNLLHYCRAIFKAIILLQKIQIKLSKFKNHLVQWLFSVFEQIASRVPNYIKSNKCIKQQKLQEVVNEYYQKYHRQLIRKQNQDVCLSEMQQLIWRTLKKLDKYLDIAQGSRRQICALSHYLSLIYQIHFNLQRCKGEQDFLRYIEDLNIQEQICQKKQIYDLSFYYQLKSKVEKENAYSL